MLPCDQGNTQHDAKAESSVRVCVSRRSARVSCSYAIQRDRQYNDDERPMTQRQLRDQLAIVKKYGIPRMMSIPKVCKDLLIGICSPEYVCSSSFGLCVALWRYVGLAAKLEHLLWLAPFLTCRLLVVTPVLDVRAHPARGRVCS